MLEREERSGANGRRFGLLRFRCTRVNALYPSRPVTTRTGRFLRYTRIADLPRFVNVVRGEVALIHNWYSLSDRGLTLKPFRHND
jgi:lipopolysaccharide/colanic/teichoic acid biosynthesis glycosyltransferase